MKRVALNATAALATLAGVLLLWELREGLLLLALSLATAATVRPATRSLIAHRVPRAIALAIVYGATVLLCATVLFVIAGPLLTETQRAANDLVRVYERLETSYFPPASELYRAMAGGAWGLTIGVVGIVGRAVIVLALAIYWTADRDAFERLALSFAPVGVRRRAKAIWSEVDDAVGARLRSEIGQSLLTLFVLALCFRVLGLAHPTLPAVVGAVTRFVPMVGAPLAILAAFAAGAMTSTAHAFAAAGCALGTMLLLTFVVAPRFAAAHRQSSLLQVVMMLVLVDAYGLAGLIAAAPLAVAIDVLGETGHALP